MADTIVGTAGAMFTLAIIAVLSFLIGLVIFGLYDFMRSDAARRRHRRSSDSRLGGSAGGSIGALPITLADLAHKTAESAADAFLANTQDDEKERNLRHWRLVSEFSPLFVVVIHGHVGPRLRSPFRKTFTKAITDVAVGNLYRSLPEAGSATMYHSFAERVAEYTAMNHDFSRQIEIPPELIDALTSHIGCATACDDEEGKERCRSRTQDTLASAVMLDLEPALKRVRIG